MAKIKILVVGAGSGGTAGKNGEYYGCGGAGGIVREDASFSIFALSFNVTIGQGGTGVTEQTNGNPGGNSIFSTITATGGYGDIPWNDRTGPGNDDFAGTLDSTDNQGAGGAGAGASASGYNAGIGVYSSITGSPVGYGGGGGGVENGNGNHGATTYGGANGHTTSGDNAPNNRGGGGGGGAPGGGHGGNGGSGIVILAYHTDGSDGILPTSTGGTITTNGGFTIHTFNSNDTFIPTYTPGGALFMGADL
jgi:hypothetical protein